MNQLHVLKLWGIKAGWGGEGGVQGSGGEPGAKIMEKWGEVTSSHQKSWLVHPALSAHRGAQTPDLTHSPWQIPPLQLQEPKPKPPTGRHSQTFRSFCPWA